MRNFIKRKVLGRLLLKIKRQSNRGFTPQYRDFKKGK